MQAKSPTANSFKTTAIMLLGFQLLSCKKGSVPEDQPPIQNKQSSLASIGNNSGESQYSLDVVLRGEGNKGGHIDFRQDRDAAKIIELNTKVHNLEPGREYLLQRAVDVINVV